MLETKLRNTEGLQDKREVMVAGRPQGLLALSLLGPGRGRGGRERSEIPLWESNPLFSSCTKAEPKQVA